MRTVQTALACDKRAARVSIALSWGKAAFCSASDLEEQLLHSKSQLIACMGMLHWRSHPGTCGRQACSEPAWPAGAAYTDLQSACSASSGTLQYVKKGQTCADLAAAGGLTLGALKQLNPKLNCKQPQSGWAVCLQSAHAAINNAATEGVRRVVQQPMQG